MIKELEINGLRGYGTKQTIKFAIPNGKLGSGLTFILGANNSGKTTISESLKAFNGHSAPSITEGKRNHRTLGRITLKLKHKDGSIRVVETLPSGGSETNRTHEKNGMTVEYDYDTKMYILSAKRYFDHDFGSSRYERRTYTDQNIFQSNRSSTDHNLVYRLQEANKNKYFEFNEYLTKLVGKNIEWTIEMRDSGSYYIKYTFGKNVHSSEGIGDGVLSLFAICDAIYDSNENTIVYIDEPELSLHPSLQKRVLSVLKELSRNRQIIISTHSPYFVDWESILNGAKLTRIFKDKFNNSRTSILKSVTAKKFGKISDNINNPHTLGLVANEVFFLEDNVVITEGQEDVVVLKKIMDELSLDIKGNFFGWGAGGADSIKNVVELLRDLKYKNVVAIFDSDKAMIANQLKESHLEYKFIVLKTEDIRDKKATAAKLEKKGLANSSGKVKDENIIYIRTMINEINNYFED